MTESGRQREDDWFRENERKLLEEARRAREQREGERKASEAKAERERFLRKHGRGVEGRNGGTVPGQREH